VNRLPICAPGLTPRALRLARTKPSSLQAHRCQCLRWEPSWEPFAVDLCGRLWTPVESKALRFGLCGRLWTSVDGACRSTDQEVGGSSPFGRAPRPLALQGVLSLHGDVAVTLRGGLLGCLLGGIQNLCPTEQNRPRAQCRAANWQSGGDRFGLPQLHRRDEW